MPKSKRDKKVSLTKTDRKGLAWKQYIIEDIRGCVDKYPHIFLFSVQNMRNNLLKELRNKWKDSRFFFGKNKILQKGLGTSKDDELSPNIHQLSNQVLGQCGLLFTAKSKDEVSEWFANYSDLEYARSGFKANETVMLSEGPLPDFSHAIEPHLRKLGMPTRLEKGIVALYKEFTVCEKGKILTPEQARILKLIGKPMATFRLELKAFWANDGTFESLTASSPEKDDDDDGDNDEGGMEIAEDSD